MYERDVSSLSAPIQQRLIVKTGTLGSKVEGPDSEGGFAGHLKLTGESRELIQECFSRLLAGSTLENANPEKGRFRSYLLGALKHFLSDRRRAEDRKKHGGDVVAESNHRRYDAEQNRRR